MMRHSGRFSTTGLIVGAVVLRPGAIALPCGMRHALRGRPYRSPSCWSATAALVAVLCATWSVTVPTDCASKPSTAVVDFTLDWHRTLGYNDRPPGRRFRWSSRWTSWWRLPANTTGWSPTLSALGCPAEAALWYT